MKKAIIRCNAEGCKNQKDGICSLREIRLDGKTGTCLSADYRKDGNTEKEEGHGRA